MHTILPADAENVRLFSDSPHRRMLIHSQFFTLCTAKGSIHPQCPQGYPHEKTAEMADFCGFHRSYPHCPQLIHNPFPPRLPMWIFMWTSSFAFFWLFTDVTKVHNHACSCMFAEKSLRLSADFASRFHSAETFARSENVKSPKKKAVVHEKMGRTVSPPRGIRIRFRANQVASRANCTQMHPT